METKRYIFIGVIFALLFFMWEQWQQDYAKPQTIDASPAASIAQDNAATSDLLQMENNQLDMPSVPKEEMATVSSTELKPVENTDHFSLTGEKVNVVTDVFDLTINTLGAEIISTRLQEYAVSSKKPDIPFELLKLTSDEQFITQSGLISKIKAADHHSLYRTAQTRYEMSAGTDVLDVPFVWEKEGIKVTKTYHFKKNDYLVEVTYKVENNSNQPWKGNVYRQFLRTEPERESAFIYTYTGGVIYSDEEKYEKIKFDDMVDENLDRKIAGGWMAMIQHYFLAAWIPNNDETNNFYSRALSGERYVLGMVSTAKTIGVGETDHFTTRLYMGPKNQKVLKSIATNLDLTVDYGYISVIAKPLFWAMQKIHAYVGNWGITIILITLLIKLVFFKLSATSYRSMANMRKLTPRIQALRERYGDDRQRMSQAMMDLYKKEKVNPMGGCLPILVQIPVFIALYWVLLESVEFRQAPFMLWINDLSIKDPYYVLPLLMGISMFIQQQLNPAPPDPVQAKILKALPIIFTLFFAFFPAGLVLYWVVNNTLSIAQQWVITRQIEKAS